jgi:hypothetical protein
LSHRCVDQVDARFAAGPSIERLGVAAPPRCAAWPQILASASRVGGDELTEEVAPRELPNERIAPVFGSERREFERREAAEPKVRRQARRRIEVEPVSFVRVPVGARVNRTSVRIEGERERRDGP